jgi:hypothetical protein
MSDLTLLGIFLALLWIGWEIHRIAQLAVNYMRGYEDGIRQRMQQGD